MTPRRLMLQLALLAALAPCGRADDTATPVPEWRAALRSEVTYGPAAAPAKDTAPAAASAPVSKAPADPSIVQMEPYTLQETRMDLPSAEAAIETPGPKADPVKWGTGLHEKKLKHVTVFYYSVLFVPIAAGFSW